VLLHPQAPVAPRACGANPYCRPPRPSTSQPSCGDHPIPNAPFDADARPRSSCTHDAWLARGLSPPPGYVGQRGGGGGGGKVQRRAVSASWEDHRSPRLHSASACGWRAGGRDSDKGGGDGREVSRVEGRCGAPDPITSAWARAAANARAAVVEATVRAPVSGVALSRLGLSAGSDGVRSCTCTPCRPRTPADLGLLLALGCVVVMQSALTRYSAAPRHF